MKDRNIASEFTAIEQHIRRAQIERSVAVARILADVAQGIGHGLAGIVRVAGTVLESVGHARHARTIEADALIGRNVVKR